MSICLGVIKTVGVTSLGIYTGMVTTSTILLYNRPCKEIFGSKEESLSTHPSIAQKIVSKLSKIALGLLTISGICFGAAYYDVPASHKHPYILYAALVTPLTYLYGMGLTFFCPVKGCVPPPKHHPSDLQNTTTTNGAAEEAKCPVSGQTAESSSSSATGASCPFSKLASTKSTNYCPLHFNISTHLIVLSLLSTVGFAQSVFGLYGEGQLA
ncbi:hypothetical protein ACO0QE_003391 [Hanseniaspora vineae]